MGKKGVRIWEEKLTIPTYALGEAEKNPMFCENRSYQGGKGTVYPYPVIEQISEEKSDRDYQAVYLENEYIRLCVLPELGGRIYRAYDKTNDTDFVYYNQVIKPVLAGLCGPWLMGGVEICWPDYHQTSTFLPLRYKLEENDDGSITLILRDADKKTGMVCDTYITLHPGHAGVEIKGQIYNGTPVAQHAFWGVNMMVTAGENARNIYPPDTHPPRRKKISHANTAQTVFSAYDFVGSYDYERKAGVLQLADWHLAPGKRRMTHGNGMAGQSWEHRMTDEDGPGEELMSGMFLKNRPRQEWIAPFEEMSFQQYLLPYKGIGVVKNATKDLAVGLELSDDDVCICVYAAIKCEVRVVLTEGVQTLYEEDIRLSPEKSYEKRCSCSVVRETSLELTVYDLQTNKCLLTYRPQEEPKDATAEQAQWEPAAVGELLAIKEKMLPIPQQVGSLEELYLLGQYIERQDDAAYCAEDYYKEGLKRESKDARLHLAYAKLLLRRGEFAAAQEHLQTAYERTSIDEGGELTGEISYYLGLRAFYEQQWERACEHFYQAARSYTKRSAANYYLAVLAVRRGDYAAATAFVAQALAGNAYHMHARSLQAYILRKQKQTGAALRYCWKNLEHQAFDLFSSNEIRLLGKGNEDEQRCFANEPEHYLQVARLYAEFGAYEDALELLARSEKKTPLIHYYRAYYLAQQKRTVEALGVLRQAEQEEPAYCFPNRLEDIAVLNYAVGQADGAMARYYLGCLLYEKGRWREAVHLWEQAALKQPKFATVHRNLALAYYNRMHDSEAARREMEKAFYLDETDARVFLELDQLYEKLGEHCEKRLARYEKYHHLVEKRDDTYVSYIALLNMTNQYEKAHDLTMQRQMHVWEGCEGAVGAQYVRSLLELANHALVRGDAVQAERYLLHALSYPPSLGEGRPERAKESHIYYHLGLALELQEKYEEADLYYKKVASGDGGKGGVMYYDAQPAERVLYEGLAHLKLGEDEAGYRCFDRLMKAGEEHLEDVEGVDCPKMAEPGLRALEENYVARNRSHCYYLQGLGYLGYGDMEQATKYFAKAVAADPSNQNCRMYADV